MLDPVAHGADAATTLPSLSEPPTDPQTAANAVGGELVASAADACASLAMDPAEIMRAHQERFAGIDRRLLKGVRASQEFSSIPAWRQRLLAHPPDNAVAVNPGTNARPRYALDGQALHQRILRGETPPPSKENAARLMWYLQALAAAKTNAAPADDAARTFGKGALSLADPDHRLENWLHRFDLYPDAAARLPEDQPPPPVSETDYPYGTLPYGLDVRGVDTPNEQKTLLIQRLPARPDGEEGRASATPMLLLKMERCSHRALFCIDGSEESPGQPQRFRHGVRRFFANLRDRQEHTLRFLLAQQGQGLNAMGDRSELSVARDDRPLASRS